MPSGFVPSLWEFFSTLRLAVPFAMYISTIISMSYSVRRRVPAFAAIALVFVLNTGLMAGAYIGSSRAEAYNKAVRLVETRNLAVPGVMVREGDRTVVLLSGDPAGPQVSSAPGLGLVYQASSAAALPPVSFGNEMPAYLNSTMTDLSHSGDYIAGLYREGLLFFIVYCAALSLLLCSLRVVFTFTVWPLADLFFGALVFRGMLAVETFFSSREILDFLENFFNQQIAAPYLKSIILGALGVIILLYSGLVHIVKRKQDSDG
jgi:hypothetical protein